MSVRVIIFFALLFSLFSAHASSDISKFSNHNKYRNVKISPTGKYLAISRYAADESELLIVNSKTMKAINQMYFKGKEEVGGFYWANDSRLVLQVFAKNRYREAPVYYGELYAIDAEKNKGKLIFGQRILFQKTRTAREKNIQKRHRAMSSSWATIIDVLPNDRDNILISAKPYSDNKNKISRIYKLNIYNADIKFIAEAPLPGANIFTDDKGELLLAIGTSNKYEKVVFEYDKDNNNWKEVQSFKYGNAFVPLSYNQHSGSLIAIDNIDHNTSSLFSLDLKSGKKKTLFHDPDIDIGWVYLSENKKRIFGITTESGYPKYYFPDVNIEEQNLYKLLIQGFKGSRVSITSSTKNLNQLVFKVDYDREPGTWYLYDRRKNKATFIARSNSKIKPEDMLPMYSISFMARDGKKISGFVTFPVTQKKHLLPAVVLVHGGPIGVSDIWRYNHEVQLLASKGYLVLQVNYRGSRGFGKEFESSGLEHWGDFIQYDILDGLQYLIRQQLVDSERVCIMGASFGGYSAVQASILAPDQFKCAIATSGVYDLELLYDTGDISKRLWSDAFLNKELGSDKAKIKLFSPLNFIDKLKTPLMLVHGDKDKRAPIEHAEALKDKLDDLNKTYKWMEMNDEGHGIYNEANRLKYYTEVIKFLHKYNPADKS